LTIDAGDTTAFREEVSSIVNEYETLRSLLGSTGETTIYLSHESPFYTEIDYHHSSDSLWARVHSGSIPLRLAIASSGPLLTLSGHMHNQCRDAIETTRGYRNLYNPGSPGVAGITVDPEQETVRIDDDPL